MAPVPEVPGICPVRKNSSDADADVAGGAVGANDDDGANNDADEDEALKCAAEEPLETGSVLPPDTAASENDSAEVLLLGADIVLKPSSLTIDGPTSSNIPCCNS
jgi:hypothetical protein